jgi:hypothetical protein
MRVSPSDWAARGAALPAAHPLRQPALRAGALEESDDAFLARVVLSSSEAGTDVATLRWEKTPFEDWWRLESPSVPADVPIPSAAYTLPAPAAVPCTVDTWSGMSAAGAPAPRSGHSAIWTGSEMIVWGGIGLNSGGRYFPATDSWLPTSTGPGVPVGSDAQSAVWTGSTMIVWGGPNSNGTFVGTGGRYDPGTDTWSPVSTTGAPTARAQHTAVWTGTAMIVWGGFQPASTATGGLYNPATDSWTPTPLGPTAPVARGAHGAIWTGTEMIVWGGAEAANNYPLLGGRFNAVTQTWTPTSTNGQIVNGRALQATVWIPPEMFVWGGIEGFIPQLSGAAYDTTLDSWRFIRRTIGVPEARSLHTGVEARGQLLVWGGTGLGGGLLGTGGRYESATDTWSLTPVLLAPTPRMAHSAVSTGGNMLIWGGFAGFGVLNTGASYCIGCVFADSYRDADGDSYGNPAVVLSSCGVTPGYVFNSLDCDDTTPLANPGFLCDLTCNGVDENCVSGKDEGYLPLPTSCGTGACARTGATSCIAGAVQDSCVPGTPQPEVCGDLLDNDCDGVVDNGCP